MSDEKLTILGHLVELRRRLIYCVIIIAITSVFSFVFADQIFALLTYRSPFIRQLFDSLMQRFPILVRVGFDRIYTIPDFTLIYTEMTEMIGTYMRVCLVSGIILAMPFLVYHIIMFVAPALTRKEKRYVKLIIPWVALMFLSGVVFGYFVLIPPAMKFLTSWGSDIALPQIKIGNYISLMTRLLLAIGIIFELPVITTFLARLGVVKAKWLASKRKGAIIIAFLVAAAITPTFDPINQTLMAAPLIVLYELSIWLAKLVEPKDKKPATVEEKATG